MEKYVPSLDTRPPLIIGGGAAVLEPVVALSRVSVQVHTRTHYPESYSKYYILYGMKM